MRPVLLNSLLVVLATIGAAGADAPGDHFQGAGFAYVWDPATECHPGWVAPVPDLVLVVERDEDGHLARIALDCPGYLLMSAFPVSAPIYALGSTYVLSGDWATGFSGTSLFGDPIIIGPYGDGKDIVVEGFVALSISCCATYFSGTVRDLRLA